MLQKIMLQIFGEIWAVSFRYAAFAYRFLGERIIHHATVCKSSTS